MGIAKFTILEQNCTMFRNVRTKMKFARVVSFPGNTHLAIQLTKGDNKPNANLQTSAHIAQSYYVHVLNWKIKNVNLSIQAYQLSAEKLNSHCTFWTKKLKSGL